MGASFSTSGKRKSSESVPPTPQPHKMVKVSKPAVVDDYQVLLSFRGPDTRRDFTDVLHEHMDRVGIRVFKDDNEISVGQEIDVILQAIENSEICVPILSESFASSAWCLREVEKMVELGKKVIPIFYKISPDDVKLKTDLYKTAMAEHEAKHGKDQVEKWSCALKKIAEIKRRQICANTSYTEFCKEFVNDALRELPPRKRCHTDHLVGMDNQTERMMKLLDIGSDNRRYVVIHGMSGIGKTTLANVIFGELSSKFDSSCFLEDVRESSRLGNGIMDLQKQLLERLDPNSVGRSNMSREIQERFCKRKVLIVLDDVDKWQQIAKLAGKSNWFGAGSRIIITTRNTDVLNKGALDEDDVRALEMETLGYEAAIGLFCWYAFRQHMPPAAFESFSREIVEAAGGLPLTLSVTGALLYKKMDVKVWRDVISRLKRTPFPEVAERLRISYDALENDQKKIFLDIACLSIGKEKAKAVFMWEACDLHPYWGLEVLSSMSLVKYVNDNEIWMHNQLRDLGKKIVREEIEDLTERSRIWEHKEALEVLMSKEEKDNVEALSALCDDDQSLCTTLMDAHFVSFKKLRFLELSGVQIEGDFQNLLPKLRWLSWHLCSTDFNVTNLCLKNLVVLELWCSPEVKTWKGWSLIQSLRNLEVLELSNCPFLTTTSDFSENMRLERLILRGCKGLLEIHGSIGRLTNLKCIDLNVNLSFRGLPEEIGSLESLEEIMVSGNDYGSVEDLSFNLPDSIGKLKCLLVLELQNFYIADIPESIGRLSKLGRLSLRCCQGIEELPESLGDLASLTQLDLSYTWIRRLPNSVGQLRQLKILNLDCCTHLEVLPESLGDLKSLVKLSLEKSKVSSLPDSVGGLQELKVLQLNFTRIRNLPESITSMGKLELFFADYTLLEEVPMEIGKLSNLRLLTLSHTPISALPSTISQLTQLESLGLYKANQLRELPELPSSLKMMRVSSSSLQKLPDITKLNNLTYMELVGANNCQWPRELQNSELFDGLKKLTSLGIMLPKLKPLPFNLGSLTQLKELQLHLPTDLDCNPLLPSSKSLSGIVLPDLSNLKNLVDIQFCNFVSKEGFESLHLGELEMVKYVYIRNCISEVIELCLLKNLERLVIQSCKSLKILPDLSHLKNFRWLTLYECNKLVDVSGLGEIESLIKLEIVMCNLLQSVECLSKSSELSEISVWRCPKLRSIQVADSLRLSWFSIIRCESLENVDQLKRISKSGMINKMPFENFD